MASTISAGLTATTALVYKADTSGVLQLQTNGTTTAVTIDTSQNVGIGVTPSAWSIGKAIEVGTVGNAVWGIGASNMVMLSNLYYASSSYKYANTGSAASIYQQAGGVHYWQIAGSGTAGNTASLTAAMTLTNVGQLLVGTSSPTSGLVPWIEAQFNGTSYNGFVSNDSAGASGTDYFIASANGTVVGQIQRVGSTNAVAYLTTSDRRLKSNITDITNSGSFIDALQPRNFTWTNANVADQGFIADEFQQVVPSAVSGEPNAIDENGNPKYQSIESSASPVIANLVAEVKSLRARLKAANIA